MDITDELSCPLDSLCVFAIEEYPPELIDPNQLQSLSLELSP